MKNIGHSDSQNPAWLSSVSGPLSNTGCGETMPAATTHHNKRVTCREQIKEAITHMCGVRKSFSLMIKMPRAVYASSCKAW